MKKDILYRKYTSKQGDTKIQLVVPTEMREKVVSVAHDTLLAGHRGAAKTLSRVQQEFYWPGVHECVTRYVASCDLCQRNVSKGTVPKAPMGHISWRVFWDNVLLSYTKLTTTTILGENVTVVRLQCQACR